jgi:hypothetical protein
MNLTQEQRILLGIALTDKGVLVSTKHYQIAVAELCRLGLMQKSQGHNGGNYYVITPKGERIYSKHVYTGN